jgi:Crp-like helix-turn-helix protein
VVGVSGLTGLQALTRNSYVQVASGSARFMLLDALNQELQSSETLRQLIERFSRGLLESMVQLAACNSLHTVQHRCVRWLLTAQDRIGRAQFELTNELLARALGIKKSKLAIVLKRLENLHLVDRAGGLVTIADRTALEELACGCYQRITRVREDAMPPGTSERFRGRANVVQLVPDVTCSRCQSAANLPHDSEHECINAIDVEMRLLTSRSTKLHALRKRLVDDRLQAMRKYLEESRKRLS